MDIDRDALFAALALRSGRIDSDRLASAFEARPGSARSLPDLLVSRGDLNPGARDELMARLDALVRQHGHSPQNLWLAVADDEVRSAVTAMSLPAFQATIDSTSAASGAAGGNGEAGHSRSADFRLEETIDSRLGGNGNLDETIDSAEVAAAPTPGRFVGLQQLGPGSGESVVSRYTRTRLHAQGGLGEIWRARDVTLDREVALKEMKTDGLRHPLLWERFVAEAKITGQLEHPNIVPVHELGRHPEDGRPFYTMRFVRGRTLAKAIADYHHHRDQAKPGTAMEFRQLLDAFLDVCNAVAFAHANGVIHRDLKGQNVVLGDYGEALLLDWGLARPIDGPDPTGPIAPIPDRPNVSFDPGRSETQHGQILGTPAYMPPEQARGEIDRLGPASDIYSLGAILFELLTGRPPHVGKDSTELLRMAREVTPPAPREINPAVPKPLQAICLHALAREPKDRYPTVSDLANDLRRWMADEPVRVYREPAIARLGRWARRHRTGVAAAAALIVTAIPLLTFATLAIDRERGRAASMEGLARTAVEDMYLEVADTILGDLSDPRQEAFLRRALAGAEATGEPPDPGETDGPVPPPIDDALRRSIGEALAFYEGFVRDGGIGPSAAIDTARARLRIGDITARLGRFDEAERSYREAIGALAPLADDHQTVAQSHRILAEARCNLADLLGALGRPDEAEPLLRRAIAMCGSIAESEPEDPENVLSLATAEVELAELLKLSGRFDEAEDAYRDAIDSLGPLAEQAEADIAARRELAAASDGLAVLLLMLDRPDEAEPLLRRALAIQGPLLAELPTVPRIREGLARTGNSLGVLLRRRGDLAGAEEALRPSIAHFERLSSDFPGRIEYRRALARGLLNLGVMLSSDGRFADAEEADRRAVDLYNALIAEAPESLKIGRDHVIALANLGTVLESRGDEDGAGRSYDRAVSAAEHLAERFEGVPDVLDALGTALINRGRLFDILGEYDVAEADLRRAATLYDGLAEGHPDRPSYVQSRAESLSTLGPILAGSGDDDGAEASYREAIGLFEDLLDDRPGDRSLRSDLAMTLANLGGLKREGAEDQIRRSLALLQGLADEQSDPSPTLTKHLGAASYNLGERLAELGRPEEAEEEMARSVAWLTSLAEGAEAGPIEQMMAGAASFKLAGLMIDRGESDAAQEPLRRAIALSGKGARAMNLPMLRETLDEASGTLVEVLLAQHRYAEAAGVAAELAEAIPNRPELRVRAAELLGDCIASVSSDPDLAPDRSDRLVADLGQRALAQLRVAVDAGYSRDDLRDRADRLGPVREQEAFDSLLAPLDDPGPNPESTDPE